MPQFHSQDRRGRRPVVEALINGAAGGIWLILAWGFWQRSHDVLGYCLVFQNGLIAWCFLVRRPPTRTATWPGLLLAGVTTMLPLLALRPVSSGLLPAGALLAELAALAWICWGLLALGRSFGIAPADRGVVSWGPYQFVRHPLYLGEIAFVLAYLLGNPSLENQVVLMLLIACQVVRAMWEEAVLLDNPTYREYETRVRWRFVPGAF